jgi:two-component system sensor histidine kinase KdpD
MPKTPEQWLEECSPTNKGGRFKLFLGYAPGVGKTHTMLTEAIRRHSRGEDVVIGVVETHGRKAVGELVANLEVVPRKDRVQGRALRRDGRGRHSRPQALRRAGG